MLKNDLWIRQELDLNLIENAVKGFNVSGLSCGVSSFGYDVRLAPDIKVYKSNEPLNPKKLDTLAFESLPISDTTVVIPPNSTAIAHTVEKFNIPRHITGIIFPKSTYTRLGLLVHSAVLEAGWSGESTITLSNLNSVPIVIYLNEGIGQVLFFEGAECSISYADRHGKYQDSKGINLSKVL